jgi:hypothetical protein
MPLSTVSWDAIHPSVYRQAAGMLRSAEATPRPHGGLRYQCPVTGSFVLITDDVTLESLSPPHARIRCVDCGEMHLLRQDAGVNLPAAIVGQPAKP